MSIPIPTIALAEIEAALTEDRLLQRAMADCVETLVKFAIDGRSIRDATIQFEELRRLFAELRPLLERARQA